MESPKTWFDVTISQYDELLEVSEIENEKERYEEQLCTLLGISIDKARSLSGIEMRELQESLKFAQTSPDIQFNRIINIDGVELGFVQDLETLTLGEWVDLDNYSFEWKENKANLASVLWRPIKSKDATGYTVEDYDSSKAKTWAAILNKKMSIQDVWGGSVFFSLIVIELLKFTKGYSTQ